VAANHKRKRFIPLLAISQSSRVFDVAIFYGKNKMNLVICNNEAQTMLSLDLLVIINEQRIEAGEPVIRNADFVSRVIDELDLQPHEIFVRTNAASGQPQKYANLSIEQCTLVGMRESKSVRRAVLAKLKELEAKQSPLPALPTFPELLRQHADALDKLALSAPKVDHFDKYVARDGLRNLTDVAKSMNLSAVRLGRLLREHGMAFKRTDKLCWMQWFVDKGYGVTKQIVANDKDRDQAMITNAGDVYLKAQFAKDGLEGLL
jgi:phage antirepressor YoqD-like protein